VKAYRKGSLIRAIEHRFTPPIYKYRPPTSSQLGRLARQNSTHLGLLDQFLNGVILTRQADACYPAAQLQKCTVKDLSS